MDLTPQAFRAINKGFKSLHDAGFGSANPQWSKIAMLVMSTTAATAYGWLGSMGAIREWVGDRVINQLSAFDFEIKNKEFEHTVGVLKTAIEDDALGVYSPLFTDMGKQAANFPDNLVFGLLKNAFTTLCYDGQYLVDTDHPVLDKNGAVQSVSNHQGGGGAPWFLIDDSRAVKPIIFQQRKPFNFVSLADPDDDNVFFRKEFIYGNDGRMNVGAGLWQLIYGSKQTLDATNYEAARAAMQSLKREGTDDPLGISPNLLVVGPSLEGKARRLLEAEKDAAGADNVNKGTAKLLVTPWLT